MHLRLDLISVHEFGPLAELFKQRRGFAQLPDLDGRDGHGELTGRLELGVDPVAIEVDAQLLIVVSAEPLDRADLVREADTAVFDPVRQRVVQEATVARARAGAAADPLQDHDAPPRRQFLGVERSPEPGVAAADDAEVALDHLLERRVRLTGRQRLRPVRPWLRVGKRSAMCARGSLRGPG